MVNVEININEAKCENEAVGGSTSSGLISLSQAAAMHGPLEVDSDFLKCVITKIDTISEATGNTYPNLGRLLSDAATNTTVLNRFIGLFSLISRGLLPTGNPPPNHAIPDPVPCPGAGESTALDFQSYSQIVSTIAKAKAMPHLISEIAD